MSNEKSKTVTTRGTFKSLIPQQVKWENEGTEVMGRLMHKETTMFRDQERGRYLIASAEGLMVVLGTYQIDQALTLVEVGETIRIKYIGSEGTNAGNRFKLFEIEVFEGADLDFETADFVKSEPS